MRDIAKLALVVLSLGVLYWPGIQHHWQTAQDPYFVPSDAVQYIPPFFKFDRNRPIPTNYVKEYYLNALMPPLYKTLTGIGAEIGDVRHFQLWMMYLTYVFFIGTLGRLGWLLGGAALSFGVMALTITGWIFFGLGFYGNAPRMYAFPLIALIQFSLIRDRPILLAIIVALGALLYPMVGLIGGLCLATWMVLTPLSGQGLVSQWGLPSRLFTVALTGCIAIAALMPMLIGSTPYGPRIAEMDIALYPEAGPFGNYRPFDQLPYQLFGSEWISYFVGPLYSYSDPVVPRLSAHNNVDGATFMFLLMMASFISVLVILCGMISILKRDHSGGGIRMISFFVICGILHILAWLTSPYLYIPTRYLMFSLPFLITLLFPWSLYTLLDQSPKLHSSPNRRNAVFLAIIGVHLIVFGGRGNVDFSVSTVANSSRPLFDAIADLPKDVVIAGWPTGEIRRVEYISRRNAFLTSAIHQVLHVNFVKTMRERMNAVFDAYLSVDAAPLIRLRQVFGVTHLLVDTRDFTEPAHAPKYFAPWRERIAPRLAEIQGKEYLLNPGLQQKAAVFNRNGIVLLDLGKLP